MDGFAKRIDASPETGGQNTAGNAPPHTILMRHPDSGQEHEVVVGPSRAVLLLGPLELARRGDWGLMLLCIVLPVIGQVMAAPMANKRHLRRLIRDGYRAISPRPGHVSHAEWILGLHIPRYSGRRPMPVPEPQDG